MAELNIETSLKQLEKILPTPENINQIKEILDEILKHHLSTSDPSTINLTLEQNDSQVPLHLIIKLSTIYPELNGLANKILNIQDDDFNNLIHLNSRINGSTPLDLALKFKNHDIARILLNHPKIDSESLKFDINENNLGLLSELVFFIIEEDLGKAFEKIYFSSMDSDNNFKQFVALNFDTLYQWAQNNNRSQILATLDHIQNIQYEYATSLENLANIDLETEISENEDTEVKEPKAIDNKDLLQPVYKPNPVTRTANSAKQVLSSTNIGATAEDSTNQIATMHNTNLLQPVPKPNPATRISNSTKQDLSFTNIGATAEDGTNQIATMHNTNLLQPVPKPNPATRTANTKQDSGKKSINEYLFPPTIINVEDVQDPTFIQKQLYYSQYLHQQHSNRSASDLETSSGSKEAAMLTSSVEPTQIMFTHKSDLAKMNELLQQEQTSRVAVELEQAREIAELKKLPPVHNQIKYYSIEEFLELLQQIENYDVAKEKILQKDYDFFINLIESGIWFSNNPNYNYLLPSPINGWYSMLTQKLGKVLIKNNGSEPSLLEQIIQSHDLTMLQTIFPFLNRQDIISEYMPLAIKHNDINIFDYLLKYIICFGEIKELGDTLCQAMKTNNLTFIESLFKIFIEQSQNILNDSSKIQENITKLHNTSAQIQHLIYSKLQQLENVQLNQLLRERQKILEKNLDITTILTSSDATPTQEIGLKVLQNHNLSYQTLHKLLLVKQFREFLHEYMINHKEVILQNTPNNDPQYFNKILNSINLYNIANDINLSLSTQQTKLETILTEIKKISSMDPTSQKPKGNFR